MSDRVYIDLEVKTQLVGRTDSLPIVSDSVNLVWARFSFTDDIWTDRPKTAVFRHHDGTAFHTPLVEVSGDWECVVPWEVLRLPSFDVSVFTSVEGRRVTATAVTVTPIKQSGLIHSSSEPRVPSPNLHPKFATADDGTLLFHADGKWYTAIPREGAQ